MIAKTLLVAALALPAHALAVDESPEKQIRDLVLAQYHAVERGDLDAWATPFAEDAFLFGSDPNEVFVGRRAILASVKKNAAARMSTDVKRSYRSTKLRISDPHAARMWAADVIDYTLESGGKKRSVTFRMTELFVRRQSRWEIVAACYSVAVPDERFVAGRWPAPNQLAPAVAAGAETIAELAHALTPGHFAGLFSDRADVLFVGTSAAEWIEGGRAVQSFALKGVPSSSAGVALAGPVHAASFGDVGFLAYNARLTVPLAGRKTTLPVRVLAIVLREGDAWKKVQEHVSIAVPD